MHKMFYQTERSSNNLSYKETKIVIFQAHQSVFQAHRLVFAEKLKNHTTMSNNYWYLTSLTSVAE